MGMVGMRHLLRPLHRGRGDADEISIEERIRITFQSEKDRR